MSSSLRLGRVLGIPIEIHWSILAVVALFTVNLAVAALPVFVPEASLRDRLIAALIGVTLFFISILAHELGHALVALGHGVGVSGITLWLLGGMAQLDRMVPTARAEFRIAAAGPAVSFLLAVFFACASLIANQLGVPDLVLAIGIWLAVVNLALTLFNLLPAAPLDGGRILTSVLWRRFDDAEGARITSGRCGLALGVLVALYGLGVQIIVQGQLSGWITVVVGLFVFQAARTEIGSAVVRRRLKGTRAAQLASAHPPPVPDTASVHQLDLWAGPAGRHTAYPVVRWNQTPIGYVVPAPLVRLPAAQRTWTTLGQVMRSAHDIDRIGADDNLDDVLTRWGDDVTRIGVVHDTSTGVPLGTLTYPQIEPLLAAPNLWGRDRNSPAGKY